MFQGWVDRTTYLVPTLVMRLLTSLVLVVAALGGCAVASVTDVAEESDGGVGVGLVDDYAYAWRGSYRGVGRGFAGGEEVTIDPAMLSIAPDADSVRLPRCPTCVTVVLDTLFALVNVGLHDPVRVVLEYRRAGDRRTLLLERFSSGLQTGNVLQARLSVVPAAGGPTVADVTYLLERR